LTAFLPLVAPWLLGIPFPENSPPTHHKLQNLQDFTQSRPNELLLLHVPKRLPGFRYSANFALLLDLVH
jgi:hypothetical protein